LKADRKRLAYLKKDAVQGFTRTAGLVPVSLRQGIFITRLKPDKRFCQQDGFVHAGLIAGMADHTSGYASYTLIPETHRILTVEFKISYLRPASGELLECKAWVVKPGRQILFTEAEVYSVKGTVKTLVAKSLSTMASVPRASIIK
jgi:uncharacterized protein (TIGR00369 family)